MISQPYRLFSSEHSGHDNNKYVQNTCLNIYLVAYALFFDRVGFFYNQKGRTTWRDVFIVSGYVICSKKQRTRPKQHTYSYKIYKVHVSVKNLYVFSLFFGIVQTFPLV